MSAYPVTIHCRSAGGEVQLTLDGRERDVDDAEVELEHELGGDHEPERPAQIAGPSMCRASLEAGVGALAMPGSASGVVGHRRRASSDVL